jgi:hypothetical protein
MNLGKNYPWVKVIQIYANEGPSLLQRGDNYKHVKTGWEVFKNLLLQNH